MAGWQTKQKKKASQAIPTLLLLARANLSTEQFGQECAMLIAMAKDLGEK